jgi:hypothetical protein
MAAAPHYRCLQPNRSKAVDFENMHVVKKDKSRNRFRWDMVKGIASLADVEPDLDIPIGPVAVLD